MKNKFVLKILTLSLLCVPCVQSAQKDCGAAAVVVPMDSDQSTEKIYTLIDTDGVSFKVSQNFVNRFKMLYDFLEDTDYSEEANKELPCPGITKEQTEFLEKLFLCNTQEQQATFADTLSFEQLFSACKALDQLGFRDQKSDDDETPHYQSFLNYVANRILSLDQTHLLQSLTSKQLEYLAIDSDFNYELKKLLINKISSQIEPQRAFKHLTNLSAHANCSSAIGFQKASPFILYENKHSDYNYKITLLDTQQTPFTSHSLILKNESFYREIKYNEKYLCYLNTQDNTIDIYDLVSKKETPLKRIKKELSHVTYFPDLTIKLYDKYCLVNDASTNKLYIFDLSKNAKEEDEALLIKTVASASRQKYTITDDCKFLLLETVIPEERSVFDLHRLETAEENHQEPTLSLKSAHISHDGKYLYYYDKKTSKYCFSSPEDPLTPKFVLPEELSPSEKCIFECFSPDSQFYLLTKETDIYIFKTKDHTLVQKITLPHNENMTEDSKINYSFSCNSEFIRIEVVKNLNKNSEVTLLKKYKDKELYEEYSFHKTEVFPNKKQQFFHKEELCIIGLSNKKTLQILDLKTNTLIKIVADKAIYQACITDENIVILKIGIYNNTVNVFELYSPLQNFILKKKNTLNCLEIITLHFAGKETQEKERKKWYPHCCGLKELINEFSHNTKANKQIITSISDSLPNPIPAKKLTPPENLTPAENLTQTTDVEANFLTDCEFLNHFIEPTQAPTPQPSYTSTDAFNQRRYNAQMASVNDNDVDDAFAAAVAAAVNDAVAVAEAATNNYQDSYEDVDMERYSNDDQNHAAADDYQYDHEMELAYYNSIQDQEKRGIKRTFSEDESSSDEGDYDIDDPKGKKRRK